MMTNHCSAALLLILGISVFLNLGPTVHAEPVDVKDWKQIPELKLVLNNVREKGGLTDKDRLVVEWNLASGDPVLVSIAACVVAESKGEETNLCAKAEAVLKTADKMPQAFIRLMLAKKRVEGKKPSERFSVIKPLVKDANPYLQVEAAKEILKNDVQRGEEALKTLLSGDLSGPLTDYPGDRIAQAEAYRQLDKIGKAPNAVPGLVADEPYLFVLSIIEEAREK